MLISSKLMHNLRKSFMIRSSTREEQPRFGSTERTGYVETYEEQARRFVPLFRCGGLDLGVSQAGAEILA